MLVLAIDTALDRTAVAVTDGRRIASSRAEAMDRGHAERLFPMIRATLDEAGVALEDMDRFVVTAGPGSFTGIRVGIACARGLSLATGRPAVGVGTLEALGASTPEPVDGPVLAAIDARRGEVYAALVTTSGDLVGPPFAADAATVLERLHGRAAAFVGSGAPILAHEAAVGGRRVPPIFALPGPDPFAVARLGMAADRTETPPAPLYLRAPDAKPQPIEIGLRT